MGDSSPAGPTDAHRLAKFLPGLTAIVALTPTGVLGACLSIAIFRFFGRRSLAVWMAIAALIFLLERIITGECQAFGREYWNVYLRPLLRLDAFQSSVLLSPTILQVAIPIGIFSGSLFSLMRVDKQRSSLERLKSGNVSTDETVAPFARLLRIAMKFRPSSHNGAAVIGTEFETGREIAISGYDRSKHVLVVGTTGAGKTISIKAICKADIDCGYGNVDYGPSVQRLPHRTDNRS